MGSIVIVYFVHLFPPSMRKQWDNDSIFYSGRIRICLGIAHFQLFLTFPS